jgi:outer membrane protein
MSRAIALVAALLAASAAAAQSAPPLSLRDAEARALQNHPQILAGQYTAQAGAETTREARSAYFPTVYGSVTGVDAQDGSRIAAGGLNNPIILDRVAAGVSVSQLLTDFGRTSNLVQTVSCCCESTVPTSARCGRKRFCASRRTRWRPGSW